MFVCLNFCFRFHSLKHCTYSPPSFACMPFSSSLLVLYYLHRCLFFSLAFSIFDAHRERAIRRQDDGNKSIWQLWKKSKRARTTTKRTKRTNKSKLFARSCILLFFFRMPNCLFSYLLVLFCGWCYYCSCSYCISVYCVFIFCDCVCVLQLFRATRQHSISCKVLYLRQKEKGEDGLIALVE